MRGLYMWIVSDVVPQDTQKKLNTSKKKREIMQMSNTKHKEHGKPTYLIPLEYMEINFSFDEISQNLKSVPIYSTSKS